MANQDAGLSGSQVMYPAVTGNSETSQAMVPAPLYAPPAMPAFGTGGPQGPEVIHGPFNQTWLFHCLRRRWLSALLLGSLFAALFAGLLLWLFPLSSSVSAILEVKSQEEDRLLESNKQRISPKEFENIMETQMALLKSHLVIKTALARDEIAQLPAVVKEGTDAVIWLYDGLQVNYQGEILEVRYDGEEDSEEMEKVVAAVIHVYQNDVVYQDRVQQASSNDELEKLRKELNAELKDKIDRYEKLAQDLGGAQSKTATAELNMLVNDIRMIQTQMIRQKEELVNVKVNYTLTVQAAKSPAALDRAVSAMLESDPTFANYENEKYAIRQQIRALQSVTRGGNSRQIKSMQGQLSRVDQEQRQYRMEAERQIRDELKRAPSDLEQQALTDYVMRSRAISESLTGLKNQYEEKLQQMKQKGESSATLSMLESEIEQTQEVVSSMEMRLQGWKVEEHTGGERIRLLSPPSTTDNINEVERYSIAGVGGLVSFCATCYAIALIEFRRRRLNTPGEVDEGLGIRVLGALPAVSSRMAMAPGSVIAAQLSESIDSVRATLMHDSTSQRRQVVLVTSPVSMEGSTTVASHLALSLTRAGRRTLLVDGDLREPSLHKLFGMPVDDGLSELLRSEIDVTDAIKPTNTEGLWLLTAGRSDMDAVHALATDQPQPIMEKLRAEFDFIVIDGAPVLSLSDSLLLGQYVDGAILTVLRDHSEIRKIHQASELLKSLGIRLIGSVVNGVPLKADRRVARLNRTPPSQPKKLSKAEE